MPSRERKGIVLITTLLMTVLVVMIVTVVVYTGAGSLALSGNFYEREAALLAADSGVQYAMARLQANPNWRGNDAATVPAGTPSFAVMEQNGNVFGFLSTVYGHKSQFRIKFNYEDGSPGADGLDNTSNADHVLTSSLVSINNLMGTSSVPAARAQEDGIGYASGEAPYSVPRATACVLVEGLAGWGLRDVDSGRPNALLTDRGVTRRVVEAYLGIDNTAGIDSAAYAAGTLDAKMPDRGVFRVTSKDDDVSPRVRSLEDVAARVDPTLPKAVGVTWDDGSDGEVVVGQTRSFTVDGTTPVGSKVTQANSSDLFKRITWASIVKASPTSTTDAQMKAGTYVWRLDDASQAYLEYFDEPYVEGAPLPAAGEGTVVGSSNITTRGTGVQVDTATMTLLVSNNISVNPTRQGGHTGLAIRTDPAVTAAGLRPNLGFVPPEGSARASVLTASGPIRVEGAVMGTGAVTSESTITFQGPSILESDPETGVSLYAKGDISVEAIPEAAADARADAVTTVATTIGSGGTLDSVVFTGGASGSPSGGIVGGAPTTGGGGSGRGGPGGGSGRRATPVTSNRPIVPPGLVANAAQFAEKKQVQLEAFADKFGRIDYADQNLTGVIYTWGNFNARLGTRGVMSMTGTLIAYGGNPENPTNSAPGSATGQGRIDITAAGVDLTYDPTYLKDLLASTGSIRVKRNLWATW